MSLQQRLLKEPQIMSEYDQTIREQMNKGIVERVPKITMSNQQPHNPIHYIPHLPVIRKERSTTQWRIQDGAFGANAPPPLVEEPAMLLIKTASKFYVRPTKISLKLTKICTFY